MRSPHIESPAAQATEAIMRAIMEEIDAPPRTLRRIEEKIERIIEAQMANQAELLAAA